MNSNHHDPYDGRKPGMGWSALSTLGCLIGIVLVLASLAYLTGRAYAEPVVRITTVAPERCHPVRCSQLRTVTTYRHGQDTIVVRQLRHRPVESRSPILFGREPWTRWHTIGAVVLPCGCSR